MGVLVTGATGFIGGSLLRRLNAEGKFPLRAAMRRDASGLPDNVVPVITAGLRPETNWHAALENVGTVIHAAARVHVTDDRAFDPLAEFRRANVEGTLSLARQSAELGVKRFIFVSSIKVNGESTPLNQPYTAESIPSPVESYAISKHEAEEGLRRLAAETGMDLVIIRPPLVYGPGVKANFLTMMRLLYKGVPLPLGAIRNKRSLVALDNLVDLLVACIDHPAAANQTFLAGDGEDLSTTELLTRMAAAMDKRANLFSVPASLLDAAAALMGKQAMALRLCGSLQVDITKARTLLDWTPPVSVDEALHQTARHFLERVV